SRGTLHALPGVVWRSVRNRRLRPLEGHEPALAVLARPSGEDDFQVQAVDVPTVLRHVALHLERVGPQQVLGRRVIAVLVLDAADERAVVVRAHVDLEGRQAGPLPVVDALTVLPVAFTAGLPVTF